LHGWSSLSAALANHYGADPESFSTTEAYWNGNRDYAELVTLDGRILGAVDRPISTADVAAIRGVRSMQKMAFLNRIRSLFNIDGYALPELGSEQQLKFLRDPVRYFLNADEAESDAIMREVESRQKSEVAGAAGEIPAAASGAALAARSQDGRSSAGAPAAAKARKAKKAKIRVEGQAEMLLPIPGGKIEEKGAKAPAPRRKAG